MNAIKSLFPILLVACAAPLKPATQAVGNTDVTLPPYNAKHDGQTDDTAAIQLALDDAAAAGGGIVFLPTGIYRIKTHLSIGPSTTLRGVFDSPPTIGSLEQDPHMSEHGTMLLAEEGAGNDSGTPFVTLNGQNASVDGLIFFYPNQTPTNPPVKYPWTIAIGINPGPDYVAYNASIQNINLGNAYQGIDLFSNDSSRHFVNNVYGEPLYRGIVVDKCYDFCEMHQVQFNWYWDGSPPLTDFITQNAIAYSFFRADGEIMSDINAHGYAIGMQLQHVPGLIDNGTYASITNLSFDGCNIGIKAIDTSGSGLNITNYSFAADGTDGPNPIGVWLPSEGSDFGALVTVTNAYMSEEAVRSEGPYGSVTLEAARINPVVGNANPRVEILGGQAIIANNTFPNGAGPYSAVHIGSSVGEAIVTGNIIGFGTIDVDPPAAPIVANNFSLPPPAR